jgi:microcystin-dependent protein
LAVQQNAALFALLGTYYGGNGQTTFQLPDLRSRVPVGWGQGTGLSNYTLGEVAGAEQVSLTISNLPSHTHTAVTTVTPTSNLAAATTINVATGIPPASRLPTPVGNLLTVPAVQGAGTAVDSFAAAGTGTAGAMAPGAATTTLSGNVSATATTVNSLTGSNIPVGLRPPLLAITYAIALVGIFPSRS